MKINRLLIKTLIPFFLLTSIYVLADSAKTETESAKMATESTESSEDSEKKAADYNTFSISSKKTADSKINIESAKTELDSQNGAEEIEIVEIGTLDTLKGIIESSEVLKKTLAEKKKEYKKADEESKKILGEEINQINALLEIRQKEFESIATGSDISSSFISPEKKFSLQEEIQDIIKPAIEELKRVTKRPREIEKLRRDISIYEKQLPIVQKAIIKIGELIEEAKDSKLKEHLKEIKAKWQHKESEITREISKLKYQLEQKLETKTSILKTLQIGLDGFFKTRGLHLFFAFMGFFAIYLLFRFIYWSIYKVKRIRTVEVHSFYYRLFQVAYHVFAFIISIMAFLFVLYSMSDWVLLIIAVIIIIGIMWTARHGFAVFWEQAKLLLNISTVREGERLIFHGIPWQIASLNLQTTLINPELKGGLNRLPLTSLIGLQSRPFHSKELWFPSRESDYVVLDDGTFGKVLMQTPEMVTIEVRGGALKTYPCSSFLEQNPLNLSINSFTVYVTFGLDYAHQAIITGEVPKIFESLINQELKKENYAEHFLRVKVQFKEAATSSLDVLVLADFSGKAASEYYAIGRAIQRILVDACNQYDWIIPFTQVTVHSAKNAESEQQPKSTHLFENKENVESENIPVQKTKLSIDTSESND